jgi:hypothetical protein
MKLLTNQCRLKMMRLILPLLFFSSQQWLHAQFQDPKFITGYCNPTQMGDMDLDGDPDLIDGSRGVWTERDENNQLLRKHYIGAKETFVTSYLTYHDFDEDGDLDAPHSDGLRLGWYVNDGVDANWEFESVYEGQIQVYTVFDINMDSHLDFLSQDYENNFYVIYGTGGGNFAPAQLYTNDYPYGFFALYGARFGNFDNDEFPDIVSSQGLYLSYQLSSNNYGVVLSEQTSAIPAAVADLNGDGTDDVIVFDFFGSTPYVIDGIAEGDYSGQSALTGIDNVAPSILAADMNGDGWTDILGKEPFSNVSFIWYGEGENSFAAPQQFSNGNIDVLPTDFYFFPLDVDQDGDLDLAVTDYFCYNNGDGTFSDPVYYNFPFGLNEDVINADTDAQAEIVGVYGQIVQINDQGEVSAIDLFNDESIPGSNFDWTIWTVFPEDFDQNGCEDFLVLQNLEAKVFQCSGGDYSTPFITDVSSYFPNGIPTFGSIFNTNDLNGDGVFDLLFGFNDNNVPRWLIFFVNPDMSVSVFDDFTGLTENYQPTIQDIDHDGDYDLRVFPWVDSYFQNDGLGNFSVASFANEQQANTFDYGEIDLNNDGIADRFDGVYATEYNEQGIVQDHLVEYPLPPLNYFLIDFNADQLPDIIYTQYTTDEFNDGLFQIRYMLNLGNFEFQLIQSQDYNQNYFLNNPKALDVDGDEDLDIVWRLVAGGFNLGYTWSENQGDVDYQISGEVFFDSNQNGIKDEGEFPVEYTNVALQPAGLYQFAGSTYTFSANEGDHEVSVNYDPILWTATTPVSYSIELNEENPVSSGNNFGLYPADDEGALDFYVRGSKTVCSGDQRFTVTIHNFTSATNDVLVTIAFDALLSYVSASIIPMNENGNELQWLLEDMLPGETRIFYVSLIYPDETTAGTELTTNASACVLDVNMNPVSCAVYDWLETQGCSYASIAKSVSPVGYTESGFIADGTELTYTIFFQNTGNASAQDLIVEDPLSGLFDLNTMQIEAASHPMMVQVSADNLVHFTFDEISLPDSASDEPGSQGYVVFRVAPFTGQGGGTIIENTASVYFDSNEPIATNTTLNTIFSCDMMGETYDVTLPCSADTVVLDFDLSYVEEYHWEMDDLVSDAPTFGFDVNAGESHNVFLTISNPICQNYEFIDISVEPDPDINFVFDGINSIVSNYDPDYTYVWTWNGVVIADADSSVLYIGECGDYTLTVTNSDGCTDSVSEYLCDWMVQENGGGKVRLFPNPASEYIVLSSNELITSICVVGVDGRIVTYAADQQSIPRIDIQKFAPGCYYARCLMSDGSILSVPFVKE